MAGGIVLTKRWGRPAGVGPTALAGWQLTAGGLLLLPLTFAVEGVPERIDAGAAGGYVWLGSMGGLIAYALWFRGIGKLPVGASAPLVLLSPLVATVIGIVSGESLSLPQAFGLVLALAAMLAAQLDPPSMNGLYGRVTRHACAAPHKEEHRIRAEDRIRDESAGPARPR
ncbi:EamA family transporter [Streptomyces sp. 142MFCol3.1]|uniref:EamA family transporter n=1 Tax=Streptomyces sp. 142MFCol3.1 TaxID=1172179 RepID=UPI000D19FA2D